MREGWKYKTIGDVCTVIGGSTPKSEVSEYWGGENYWVTPAELNGNKYQGATNRTITNLAVQKTNLKLLPKGTVLLSSRAPIGKVAITTVPMYCNQGFKNIICSENLLNEFVYWYLYNSTEYLNSLGTGATFKEISKKTTESIVIPVPPLPEQERIVAELDLLTGIIDKQKAQLGELDTLAQSIFYDMFGDPIENEKGWKVEKMGEVCTIERGGSPRPIEQYLTDAENGINWIKIGDATDGGMVITSTKQKIKPEGMKKSRYVHKGDFLLSNSMSFGRPYILGVDGCIHDGWLVIQDTKHVFNKIYLYYLLGSSQIYKAFQSMAVGGVVNNLNKDIVKAVRVAIPGLEFQESFAQKIQSIESQKESINRSIAETQKLFDYTMDKYFG